MKIVQMGLGSCEESLTKILAEFGVLSAVYDKDSNQSKKISEKYSINHYSSEEELISSENFEGVLAGNNIAVKTITNLLHKKKHVFLEKSFQLDSVEMQKLKDLSEKNKVVLTWGLDERFNSLIENIRHTLKQKKFGEIIMLELYRQNIFSQENKRTILESVINEIDIANVLFDEFPVVVFARLGYSEEGNGIFASIMLGYKNNKTAVILSNGALKEEENKLHIFCTDAILHLDVNREKIKISNQESSNKIEKRDSKKFQIKNFIEAIEDKSEVLIKPNDMLNLTKIIEGALLSGNQGIPIYLDLK